MGALYKREMKSYFSSPTGYMFVCVFLIFSGLFFKMANLDQLSGDIVNYFNNMLIVFIFLVPILTMKLFSEEKRSKTDQLLLSSPVKISGIVLGKYFAALSVFVISLIPTLVNVIIIAVNTKPEYAIILGNYVGIFFLGAAFIAIGAFLSSLTESQVVAAVLSFAVMLSLYFLSAIVTSVKTPIITKIVSFISVYNRYQDFVIGLFNIASVIYYFSLVAIFIFLTIRVIERRRWS